MGTRQSNQSGVSQMQKLEAEKRERNCFLIGMSIIVMGVMGFIYMLDLNTIVTSFIAGALAVVFNGIGSLPFTGWEPVLPAVIASSLKTVLLAIFVGAFGLAWFVNKQNR